MSRNIKTCRTLTLLIVTISFFIGCATGGKSGVDQSATQSFSMQPLEDGRIGYIIKEDSTMDATARKNFDLAVSMLKDKKYEEAIPLLQGIIDQSPGVTAPYVNMAIACQAMDKPEKAETYLKTALTLYPDHPVVCNEFGLLYRKTGRFTEAKEMYEKAIARFPEYYPAHRNLGILCDLYLNDTACALKHYEIYSKANPKDKQVKMWIAGIKLAIGTN